MDIYEIIGCLLGALVVILLFRLSPKVMAWIDANLDAVQKAKIMRMVRAFCRAAEQLLHDSDPTGEKRKKYVIDQLRLAGVAITEAILNMLEGEVWEINTENKKAQVQAVALDGLELEFVEKPVDDDAEQ